MTHFGKILTVKCKPIIGLAALLFTAVATAHAANPDWLIDNKPYQAKVIEAEGTVTLDNGLVRRVIRTQRQRLVHLQVTFGAAAFMSGRFGFRAYSWVGAQKQSDVPCGQLDL